MTCKLCFGDDFCYHRTQSDDDAAGRIRFEYVYGDLVPIAYRDEPKGKTDVDSDNEDLDAVKRVREMIRRGKAPELTGDREMDSMLADCLRTVSTKGDEYTVGSADRLANFRGAANDVGVSIEQAWYIFFNKHYRAVQSYIKNGRVVKSNESIRSRLMDLIVYLLLFTKMTHEFERTAANTRDDASNLNVCER